MRNKRFECQHMNPDSICRLTFEPCTMECGSFGSCAECVAYFMPSGQYPCKGCSYNKLARKEEKPK